jgi:predicted Mrr-cat superfamily restriction endonuclease
MGNMEIKNSRSWKIRVDDSDDEILKKLSQGDVIIDYGVDCLIPGCSKEEVLKILRLAYSESSPKRIAAHAGQIYNALSQMSKNDLIVVPINKGQNFHIGRIISNRPSIIGTQIVRRVKWVRRDIPLSNFEQDIRYSFMAIMKVCEVKRNNSFTRLSAVAEGDADPGF